MLARLSFLDRGCALERNEWKPRRRFRFSLSHVVASPEMRGALKPTQPFYSDSGVGFIENNFVAFQRMINVVDRRIVVVRGHR